jgi:hypothetical protein
MEMRGHYDQAIDIFQTAFDFGVADPVARQERWRSTLGYRIGVLHYRAGRLGEADRLLRDAAEQDAATESWATQERVLCALGTVALDRGAAADGAAWFARGLDLCRPARSGQGTRDHALGLVAALLLGGSPDRARAVCDELAAGEDVALDPADGAARPSPPSPKLPAYFPEIDLEDIPKIDISRYLGNAPPRDAPRDAPWRD